MNPDELLIKMRELGPWRRPDISPRDCIVRDYVSLDALTLWLTATKGAPARAVPTTALAERPD